MKTNVRQAILGSVAGLVILNVVLFTSFLAQIQPHPAVDLGPLGGAGPFIGTTIVASSLTGLFAYWRNPAAYGVAVVAVVLNLITFGPHKLLGEQAALVYPAVVTGTLLTAVLLGASVIGFRARSDDSDDYPRDSSPSGDV